MHLTKLFEVDQTIDTYTLIPRLVSITSRGSILERVIWLFMQIFQCRHRKRFECHGIME